MRQETKIIHEMKDRLLDSEEDERNCRRFFMFGIFYFSFMLNTVYAGTFLIYLLF